MNNKNYVNTYLIIYVYQVKLNTKVNYAQDQAVILTLKYISMLNHIL